MSAPKGVWLDYYGTTMSGGPVVYEQQPVNKGVRYIRADIHEAEMSQLRGNVKALSTDNARQKAEYERRGMVIDVYKRIAKEERADNKELRTALGRAAKVLREHEVLEKAFASLTRALKLVEACRLEVSNPGGGRDHQFFVAFVHARAIFAHCPEIFVGGKP